MGFVGGYRHIEQVRVVRFITACSLFSLISHPDSILKRAGLISPVLSVCLVQTGTVLNAADLTAIVCEDVTVGDLEH